MQRVRTQMITLPINRNNNSNKKTTVKNQQQQQHFPLKTKHKTKLSSYKKGYILVASIDRKNPSYLQKPQLKISNNKKKSLKSKVTKNETNHLKSTPLTAIVKGFEIVKKGEIGGYEWWVLGIEGKWLMGIGESDEIWWI